MACPVEYNHIFNVSGSFAAANKWIINCSNSSNNKSEHDDKCPLNAGNCTHCGLGLSLCVCVCTGPAVSESKCKNLTGSDKNKKKVKERNDKHTRATTVPVPVPVPFWVPLPLRSTERTYFDNKSSSALYSILFSTSAQLWLNSDSSVYLRHSSGLSTVAFFGSFNCFSQVISAWHCDCLISRLAA